MAHKKGGGSSRTARQPAKRWASSAMTASSPGWHVFTPAEDATPAATPARQLDHTIFHTLMASSLFITD